MCGAKVACACRAVPPPPRWPGGQGRPSASTTHQARSTSAGRGVNVFCRLMDILCVAKPCGRTEKRPLGGERAWYSGGPRLRDTSAGPPPGARRPPDQGRARSSSHGGARAPPPGPPGSPGARLRPGRSAAGTRLLEGRGSTRRMANPAGAGRHRPRGARLPAQPRPRTTRPVRRETRVKAGRGELCGRPARPGRTAAAVGDQVGGPTSPRAGAGRPRRLPSGPQQGQAQAESSSPHGDVRRPRRPTSRPMRSSGGVVSQDSSGSPRPGGRRWSRCRTHRRARWPSTTPVRGTRTGAGDAPRLGSYEGG